MGIKGHKNFLLTKLLLNGTEFQTVSQIKTQMETLMKEDDDTLQLLGLSKDEFEDLVSKPADLKSEESADCTKEDVESNDISEEITDHHDTGKTNATEGIARQVKEHTQLFYTPSKANQDRRQKQNS